MSALSGTGAGASAEGRQWLTLAGRRTVLVVAHSLTYLKRLVEVLALLEDDFRLQVAFTAPPHVFGSEVPQSLERLGSAVLPWDEATSMSFDLALAAGPRGLEAVRAPLITLPHGANYVKRIQGVPDEGVAGLRRRDLLPGGRLPAAVVVPHEEDLRDLARQCPEALPIAHVVGDPAHDRMAVSIPRRAAFRRALGLAEEEKLLALVSTWGPHSSFGRFEALLPRLHTELPASTRVAVLLHPNVWSAHGAWQVKAWLARSRNAGVHVVPPEADWRSVLIAADWIIGDHGSVTLYGTLTGAPLLLASSPRQEINPASPAATLAHTAPTLCSARPLPDQLEYAAARYRAEEYAAIAARLTSEPGRFNRNMRRLIYRVMGLGEPAYEPVTRLLPEPPAMRACSRDQEGVLPSCGS